MTYPEKNLVLKKRDSIVNKNKFKNKNYEKSNKVIKYKIKQNYFKKKQFMILEEEDFCENDILENYHLFLDKNNYKDIYYLYKEFYLWNKFVTKRRLDYLKSK